MKVLIDGENFRHQVASVLVSNKLINDKNSFFKFAVTDFFKSILDTNDLEIVYYTTKIKHPTYKVPVKLTTLITKISKSHRKWIAMLVNQKVTIIKAGYLRVRESNSCVHCGKKTLVLQEKGVDVRMATDLVLMSAKDKHVTFVSSDSDLAPALQSAKQLGAKLHYVCYSSNLNRSVAAYSTSVITFKDTDIIKFFGK